MKSQRLVREYSVYFAPLGTRTFCESLESALKVASMSSGVVEWRTGWQLFEHENGCKCLICDPDPGALDA